ncbi:hypothetical protein [Bacteroides ndongoniae]|jgi:hypothetical protein|uniref:hypothetical protein n=1 Tax=Bacteroides ndongoniae TaxID=1903262 RepID=UPI0023F6D062|nr:hypothetical protein [Bacteroides ndongoniae]
MKRKYFLAFMVLPALFAACTNDDFDQMQTSVIESNAVLQDRAKGFVTLDATKGSIGADTRVVGGMTENGGIDWYWEGPDDKLGAVVVDYGDEMGTDGEHEIVDLDKNSAYAITNYRFEPNITEKSQGANFSTPSAVVSGAYLFYNKYDGKNTARRVISHEIDRLIDVSEGTEAGLEQVGTNTELGGQNFFISPIVDLAVADGQEIAKPLNLTSVYHILNFKLKTELDAKYYQNGGFKIHKIVLTPMENNKEFNTKLTINPAAIATIQKNLRSIPENAKYFKANGAIDALNLTDDEIKKALELVNNEIANPANSIGRYDETQPELVYQLKDRETGEAGYSFTKEGEEMSVMVILPADTYKSGAKAADAPAYQGATKGIFHLRIYTSEGTYDEYMMSDREEMTFLRGKMNNVSRTLKIKGGETNINLFDLEKGFTVETTEDWNYTIDYINEHYRDYGNTSEWNAPTLNLVSGKVIDVDAEHYFPAFPVKYVGNATLNLTGQSSYNLDPKNMILATAEKRPTIQISDQKDATVTFQTKAGDEMVNANVNKVIGNDGEDATCALKLITDAKVVVAEKQIVTFELLTSNTELNIAKEGQVISNGTTTTGGKVVLAKGTDASHRTLFTVNEQYINNADIDIKEFALVTLNAASTNNGTISVTGELDSNATFSNAKGANVTVNAYEVGMNNASRGIATFTTVENLGTVDIAASVDKKGTYGGKMEVETELKNAGKVNNNGELTIQKLANSGTLTLMSDPYAMLIVTDKANSYATNTQGVGSIVLEDAREYEMFDSYYTGRNDLKDGVNIVAGVIETTLTNDEYVKVLENYNTYNAVQETAWDVLNKVTVDGEIKLKALLSEKDYVLLNNSSINAQASLTINSLVVNGTATALNSVNNATINVSETVTVNAGAELTNNVSLIIAPNANTMLKVAGQLTNAGTIDTEDSNTVGEPNNINVVIDATGKLINKGKLSKKSEPKYSGEAYDQLIDLIGKLKNEDGTKFVGQFGNLLPRVEKWDNNPNNGWIGNTVDWAPREFGKDRLLNTLSQGTFGQSQGFWYIQWQVGSSYLTMYLGLPANQEPTQEFKDLVKNLNDSEDGMFNTAFAEAVNGIQTPYLNKTWFSSQNSGTLDLSHAGEDKVNCWAYGKNVQVTNKAVKIGFFNNEKGFE